MRTIIVSRPRAGQSIKEIMHFAEITKKGGGEGSLASQLS
jgi:hypothetical protein